jgi:hypothetical protein
MGSISLIRGELEVISTHKDSVDNMATINTTLISIILNKGKFIITADDRTAIIVVLDGSLTVLDNASKKKEVVTAKNTAVIVPAPKFSARNEDLSKKRGNIFNIKESTPNDIESYLSEINILDDSSKKFRFIIIDKTVHGVKID